MALTKSLSFSLGRKRVLISNNNSCDLEQFCADFESFIPMKRQNCFGNGDDLFDERFCSKIETTSLLEALPRELLIKVVCGVNHEDLKQLFLVSKTVRDAAIIAKKSHFAYSTPSKMKAFRNSIDLSDNAMDLDEIEAPNAPRRARRVNRPKINKKKLDDISVALFSDDNDEEQRWPRRTLFMESNS